MSVNLIKWTPKQGDYVFVTLPSGLASGQVTTAYDGCAFSVRIISGRLAGRYAAAHRSQLAEHPQNRWGA